MFKELGVGVKPISEAQFCCILKIIISNVRSCGDEMRWGTGRGERRWGRGGRCAMESCFGISSPHGNLETSEARERERGLHTSAQPGFLPVLEVLT